MISVLRTAEWLDGVLTELELAHAFIGGIAVLHWGDPRPTVDVDVAVLVGFGDESTYIDKLLARIPPRTSDAREHALKHRVLLCVSPDGIKIDLGLAAFPYEEDKIGRRIDVEIVPGIRIPIISAEDVLIMKVFAGRPRDWEDVKGIIARSGHNMDWGLVERELPPLLELLEEPDRMETLAQLREEYGNL